MDVLDKLRARTRTLGVARTALFLLQRSLRTLSFGTVVFHLFYLHIQPVRATPVLSERLRAGLTIRPLETGEAEQAAFVVPINMVTAWFERGDTCLAAYRGDDLVGLMWLHFGPFDEVLVRCQFVPTPSDRVGWDFNLHVVSHERGGLVLAALWDAANHFLRARGCDWTASATSVFNSGSLRAHARLGAHHVGSAFFLRLGPFQITVATLPPFVHFSLHPAQIPTIYVAAPDTAR